MYKFYCKNESDIKKSLIHILKWYNGECICDTPISKYVIGCTFVDELGEKLNIQQDYDEFDCYNCHECKINDTETLDGKCLLMEHLDIGYKKIYEKLILNQDLDDLDYPIILSLEYSDMNNFDIEICSINECKDNVKYGIK